MADTSVEIYDEYNKTETKKKKPTLHLEYVRRSAIFKS